MTAWYAGQEGTDRHTKQSLTQTNHTRWCINTIRSPDDEHCDVRNMWRDEINKYIKKCVKLVISKNLETCLYVSHPIKWQCPISGMQCNFILFLYRSVQPCVKMNTVKTRAPSPARTHVPCLHIDSGPMLYESSVSMPKFGVPSFAVLFNEKLIIQNRVWTCKHLIYSEALTISFYTRIQSAYTGMVQSILYCLFKNLMHVAFSVSIWIKIVKFVNHTHHTKIKFLV